MRISGTNRITFLALVLGARLVYAAGDVSARPVDIAVHKAVYDFKLVAVEASAGINDVTGRMYFEQDDTCDAWTTEHRFITEYHYAEKQGLVNTSHYVAFESKDRQQFSFSSDRQENGEEVEQLRGSVEFSADGAARAIYSRPDDLKYDLPKGHLFPTMHTTELIRHARAGENFFVTTIFDGTDAEGPVEISAFIGKKSSAAEIEKIRGANKKIDGTLLTPDAWHVRLAVFPLNTEEDIMPSYEMDILMHDNGVVSHALVDYKTFKLEQNLSALEKLPVKKCN